jgi:hypothetical protein
MDPTTFWAWLFGFASIASLIVAVYIYFRSREYIYPLIEKLRASRNNFVRIGNDAKRIASVADSEGLSPDERVRQMRQLSMAIAESTWSYMNTIDDGIDWEHLSVRAIYDRLR